MSGAVRPDPEDESCDVDASCEPVPVDVVWVAFPAVATYAVTPPVRTTLVAAMAMRCLRARDTRSDRGDDAVVFMTPLLSE